jgi:hypothetical protein
MVVNGLSPQTNVVFENVSKLGCIIDYCLIGGTALALQIDHRHSEDLDFCIWKKSKQDKTEVQWPTIFKELTSIGEVKKNLLGFDHCDFYLKGTKISFFVLDTKEPENLKKIQFLNNLAVADLSSIGAMKMDVMQRRASHRDYYDVYSLLQSGISMESLIASARKYSKYQFKTREIESLLVNSDRFTEDKDFYKLHPKYDVTLKDIEQFMIEKVKQMHQILPYQATTKLASISQKISSKNSKPSKSKNSKLHQP